MEACSSLEKAPGLAAAPATCEICKEAPSKYMCPRCGVPYCSLSCYKNEKHLQCSESFYKDCVLEKIKSEEVENPEGAKKMKEILQRVHQQYNSDNYGTGDDQEEEEEEEELDSDDDEPLEKRLEGIDLSNAEQVWKHLTPEERREFQALAKNAELAGDLIPEWIPWWNMIPERKLVVDVDEGSDSHFEKLHKHQPDWLQPIPKMSDLTKVQPNQQVAKGLINVVTAYVWASRLFNGDLFDSEKIVEAASCMIYLSSFLSKDGVFKNIEHAIADVPLNACRIPVLSEGGDAIQANLSRDVWLITKGPANVHPLHSKSYLLSALTECYRVFSISSKILKRTKPEEAAGPEKDSEDSFSKLFPPVPLLSADLKLVNTAKRKLFYLIAFANEYLESAPDISEVKP